MLVSVTDCGRQRNEGEARLFITDRRRAARRYRGDAAGCSGVLGDAAETARSTAQSLLRSAAATYDGATGNTEQRSAVRRGEARTGPPSGTLLLRQLSATASVRSLGGRR